MHYKILNSFFSFLCFCFIIFSCSTKSSDSAEPENLNTLSINTVPIYAEIEIDGVPKGLTPLSLSLTEGEYTVSFNPIDGFEKPSDTTFSLTDSLDLKAEYKCLLLDSTPHTSIASGSLWVWGTPQKQQKNGTIYDYINGPGDIYIEHGFEMVIKQNYKDTANRSITAEVYYMNNPDSALSLFNDSRLRTQGEVPVEIGDSGVVYNPTPDYIINFYQKRFYVSVSASNDDAASEVDNLARIIDNQIKVIK